MTTTNPPSNQPKPALVDVSPETLAQWLASGDTVLIDVREDFEHAQERIDGSVPAPLSKLDPSVIHAKYGNARIVFHCAGGKRSAQAAARCCREGERAFHLAGGIESWKDSGRPVTRSAGACRIPIMRQALIGAGSLVAIGTVLSALVSPWFLILTGFAACGLLVAGTTGFCGMAFVLRRMPWNRTPSTTK